MAPGHATLSTGCHDADACAGLRRRIRCRSVHDGERRRFEDATRWTLREGFPRLTRFHGVEPQAIRLNAVGLRLAQRAERSDRSVERALGTGELIGRSEAGE